MSLWGVDPRLEKAIKKAGIHKQVDMFLLIETQKMKLDEILSEMTESEKVAFAKGFAIAMQFAYQAGQIGEKVYREDIQSQFPQYFGEGSNGKDNADHT